MRKFYRRDERPESGARLNPIRFLNKLFNWIVGSRPKVSVTFCASPKKSAKPARDRDTPAPQKKIILPSCLATSNSSGIDGPSAKNRIIQKVYHMRMEGHSIG